MAAPASSTSRGGSSYLQRSPSPSGLADVLELILDKGLVIDIYVRVSLIGIEILTIDARIVIASVDTYLRFAEAVNRLDIASADDKTDLPGMVEGASGAASSMLEGGADAAIGKVKEAVGAGDDDDDEDDD